MEKNNISHLETTTVDTGSDFKDTTNTGPDFRDGTNTDSDFKNSTNRSSSSEKNKKRHAESARIRRHRSWENKSYKELKEEVRKQFIEQGYDDVSDKVVESIAFSIIRDIERNKNRKNIFSLLRISLLFTSVAFLILLALLLSDIDGKYVGKSELQIAVKNTVIKDVSLDDLKIVFTKNSNNVVNNFWPILKPHLYYKKSGLTLIDILNDLKVDIYVQEGMLNKEQLSFVTKIDTLIIDYNKVNPFDGLDEQDIRDFRGISDKLNLSEYNLIQAELLSLTSSMKVKNNLIHEYLSSSNISLYISITAFLFSVIISIWQFYVSRRENAKKLVSEAIKEHQNFAVA
jgi:hypothetical protein